MRNPHGNPRGPHGCDARRGQLSEYLHGCMRFASVRAHQPHTARVLFGDLQKRRVHASVEVLACAFHAIGPGAARGALEPLGGACRHQQDGAIGHDTLAGERVGRFHERAVEPAPIALVGHGGIGEAIAQDHGPALERRGNDLADQLRTCRLEDEQLGSIAHIGVRRVQHHAAQLLAHLGAAGLAKAHDLAAHGGEGVGQKADMGGLAGAVAALERDEHAALGRLLCGKPLIGGLRGSSRVHRGARSRTALAHHRHLAHDARVADIGHVAIPAPRRPRRPPRLPQHADRTARA